SSKFEIRLVYRKKMLENRHFLIGIFQHFTTVADISTNLFEAPPKSSTKSSFSSIKTLACL
ncbi:hypothetical protein, partial [Lactiplantibacillus pentosus]|uniref:hypothetical protein n=1 Tax=Lactiplantibacillus pentosus TaxID=1589 RepID=UPI0021A42519